MTPIDTIPYTRINLIGPDSLCLDGHPPHLVEAQQYSDGSD